eukprot:7869268-Alexandrium_andersonii.AAC.1
MPMSCLTSLRVVGPLVSSLCVHPKQCARSETLLGKRARANPRAPKAARDGAKKRALAYSKARSCSWQNARNWAQVDSE